LVGLGLSPPKVKFLVTSVAIASKWLRHRALSLRQHAGLSAWTLNQYTVQATNDCSTRTPSAFDVIYS